MKFFARENLLHVRFSLGGFFVLCCIVDFVFLVGPDHRLGLGGFRWQLYTLHNAHEFFWWCFPARYVWGVFVEDLLGFVGVWCCWYFCLKFWRCFLCFVHNGYLCLKQFFGVICAWLVDFVSKFVHGRWGRWKFGQGLRRPAGCSGS